MSGFTIEGAKCVRDSGKAICVEAPYFDNQSDGSEWIPQSQVHEDSEVYKKGDEGDLIVTEWWARKQGWI